MKKWFIDILKNPQTEKNIEYQKDRCSLFDTQTNQLYEIFNGVPVFIQDYSAPVETELHKNLDTKFNYIEHYQKDAEVFDYFSELLPKSSRIEEKFLRKHILSEIPKEATLVLDVGCGSAWLSHEMLKKERNIVSLDISLVNTVKALERNPSPHHAAIVADVFNLPFGLNTFDCIVASEIMEHLYDPLLFIQKLLHILKPHGKLIITTPYKEVLEYHLCVHCNNPTPKNAHIHTFDEKKMHEIAQRLNIKKVKIKIFNNKPLIKLRIHVLINALGFKLWRFIDTMICKLNIPAYRIMTIFTKNE